MGCNPIDKNVIQKLKFPLDFRIKQYQYTNSKMKARHQIKIATSKLSNSMIFFKFAHVAGEFHKSQVQNNSFTMIMLQMNSKGFSMMYQMKFQIASTWLHESWHCLSPFAYGVLPNSKSKVSDQIQQSTQIYFQSFCSY